MLVDWPGRAVCQQPVSADYTVMLVPLLCYQAVNKDGAFPGEYMNRALHKTIRENCDVNNLSLGSFNVVPNPSYRQGMEETAAADILTTAAAGNDEGAITLGPRLFGTASPASYPKVFAVAHLQNAANPGSLVEISTPISTSSGLRNMLGEEAQLRCCLFLDA